MVSPITQIIIIVILIFAAVVLMLKPMSRADEEASARMEEIKRGVRRPPKKRKCAELFKKNADDVKPLSTRLAERVNEFVKPGNSMTPLTKNDREIKKLMAVARVNISMATFFVLRVALGVVVGIQGFIAGMLLLPQNYPPSYTILATVVMFMGGTLIPKTILRITAQKRRMAIVSSLTDTIDLLAISVEAGLGYDAAILSIWKENKSPAMQELMRTIEDINYGMSRRDAYQSLAARCDVEEMSLFSNNMVQADIMGISIVNVLKAQADALREARRRRAETQVQKAPIKMLLPLVFFVFPTMMLVLLGPAIINIFLYL